MGAKAVWGMRDCNFQCSIFHFQRPLSSNMSLKTHFVLILILFRKTRWCSGALILSNFSHACGSPLRLYFLSVWKRPRDISGVRPLQSRADHPCELVSWSEQLGMILFFCNSNGRVNHEFTGNIMSPSIFWEGAWSGHVTRSPSSLETYIRGASTTF